MSPKFVFAIRCVLALIWLYNGLWLKILAVDPHHLEIVQAVFQISMNQAADFLNVIGLLETLLGIGILSGLFHRFVNYFQVFILIVMNSVGIVGGEGSISNPAGLLIMNLPTILCAIIVARHGPGAWALRLRPLKAREKLEVEAKADVKAEVQTEVKVDAEKQATESELLK